MHFYGNLIKNVTHTLFIYIRKVIFGFSLKTYKKQAGAELGQAQRELGLWENDLSLRCCIRRWG